VSAWLLRGATLVELDPPRVEQADLLIEGCRIVGRGVGLAAESVVDGRRLVVMPGLVNAHTHLYSALARGLPAPAVEDFGQALERIWWPLDRSLDHDGVAHSALVGVAEAALAGTTTLIDHHASPSAIAGSLDAVAAAYRRVGIRGALCYEVTDRNGPAGAAAGIDETLRGDPSHARHVEGLPVLVGLHASFTLEEHTLQVLAEGPSIPLHVHVAEGAGDVEDARRRGYRGVLHRLDHHCLLRPGSVLAHGVHLDHDEVALAQQRGCWLVHNPASNRNNRVGYAHPGRFGERVALGTDGIGSDMLAAFREAFLAAREHQHDLDLLALWNGGHRLASTMLGERLGTLQPGAAADFIALDHHAPTPLTADNVVGHLLFGFTAAQVRHVWCRGEPVVRDRRLCGVDWADVAHDARVAARALWERYESELA